VLLMLFLLMGVGMCVDDEVVAPIVSCLYLLFPRRQQLVLTNKDDLVT